MGLRALQRACADPKPSLARLAEELHRLGGRVCYGDLTGGEEDRLFSLASLSRLRQELCQAQERIRTGQLGGDIEAVARLRAAARRGRQRALRVARNPRGRTARRAAAEEMADWLLLWLEMPEAFFDWLEVRQRTEEFRAIAACETLP